jgi:hypothetical protein
MYKFKKKDINNLDKDKKYKFTVCGYKQVEGKDKFIEEDIDVSDLSMEELGVIGGFLDSLFDDIGFDYIGAAKIDPIIRVDDNDVK